MTSAVAKSRQRRDKAERDPRREWARTDWHIPSAERAANVKAAATVCLRRALALAEGGFIDEAETYVAGASHNLNHFIGYTARVPQAPFSAAIQAKRPPQTVAPGHNGGSEQ